MPRLAPLLAAVLIAAGLTTTARAQPVVPPEVAAYATAKTGPGGPYVGLVVGIVDASGRVVRGFGRVAADSAAGTPGRSPDGRTRFEIGSVSKTLTGLLLADAVLRGDLALDTRIDALLPDTLRLDPRLAAVTAADLSTHHGGLPRLPLNMGMPGVDLDLRDPYARYDAARLTAFLAALRPGAGLDTTRAFAYSNVGAGMLGHLLARRAGTTYAALVQRRIAGPLGLADTFVGTGGDAAREATGHTAARAATPPWAFTDVLVGAGGVRSTADDMLALLAAYLDPAPSPLRAAMDLAATPRADASRGRRIGLGWFTGGPGERLRWHNGGTGGFTAFVGFDPSSGRGVVVLSNASVSVDVLGMHLLDPSVPLDAP